MTSFHPTLQWLRRRRVAVLKGGWSKERPISLKTGAAMEASLRRLGIRPISIDVTPRVAQTLAARRAQFCFLALHGPYGEDGRIQGLLDVMGIGYTGEGCLASGVAMDKESSKRMFRHHGVATAPWATVHRDDARDSTAMTKAEALLKHGPVFVKPVDQGSAIGVSRVSSRPQLASALRTCFRLSDRALVERFIHGRELTVGVIGSTALPVVEIKPEHAFYDFHSKYAKGGSVHLCPAPLTPRESRLAQATALAAFRAIDARVYGRVDLILERGRMFVLEVNTIPGMTATSLLPDAARAAGLSFDDLMLWIAHESRKARAKELAHAS